MFLTVYVTAWDEGCRLHLENLSKTNFRYKVIDIDENYVIAAEQKIKAVPTTQFYDSEGALLGTKWGAATIENIKEWAKDLTK